MHRMQSKVQTNERRGKREEKKKNKPQTDNAFEMYFIWNYRMNEKASSQFDALARQWSCSFFNSTTSICRECELLNVSETFYSWAQISIKSPINKRKMGMNWEYWARTGHHPTKMLATFSMNNVWNNVGTMNQKQMKRKRKRRWTRRRKRRLELCNTTQTHKPIRLVLLRTFGRVFGTKWTELRATKSLEMSLVYISKVRIWSFLLRLRSNDRTICLHFDGNVCATHHCFVQFQRHDIQK